MSSKKHADCALSDAKWKGVINILIFDLVELMSRTAKIDSVEAMSVVGGVAEDLGCRLVEYAGGNPELLGDIEKFVEQKIHYSGNDHACAAWRRLLDKIQTVTKPKKT